MLYGTSETGVHIGRGFRVGTIKVSFQGRMKPPMLSKCANLACSTPFRRLREGKLFQVETEYFDRNYTPRSVRKERALRRIEHYWLCDACSPFVTLTFDRIRGVITVPLPDGAGEKTVRVLTPEERAIAIESEEVSSQMLLHEVRK